MRILIFGKFEILDLATSFTFKSKNFINLESREQSKQGFLASVMATLKKVAKG